MRKTLQQRSRASFGAALETSEPVARSPWPAILDRVPDFEPDVLRVSLEFYRESVMRRVIDDDGHVSLAMLDIAEVARALSAGVSLASGILPGDETGTNTLFWSRSNGATRLGIWAGPRIWRISLRSPEPGGKDRRLLLPFPGLLFVCRPDASGAYVFAASKRPQTAEEALYCCPAPNVFANGRICPGDHAFARDPLKLPSEFFLSKFRVTADTRGGKSRKHPEDVSRLWDELASKERFPMEDLVPILTVQQACDLAL
jgi:E2/UBC family protein D